MKIFLGLAIVVLSTFLGYCFSVKFKERKDFFRGFSSFNKLFLTEVQFGKKTLPQIIGENNNENVLFNKIINGVLSGEKPERKNLKFLDEDEYSFLISYVENMGRTDVVSQTELLKNAETYLSDKNAKCEAEEKKNKTLYIKIGFLLGLMGFVLII